MERSFKTIVPVSIFALLLLANCHSDKDCAKSAEAETIYEEDIYDSKSQDNSGQDKNTRYQKDNTNVGRNNNKSKGAPGQGTGQELDEPSTKDTIGDMSRIGNVSSRPGTTTSGSTTHGSATPSTGRGNSGEGRPY